MANNDSNATELPFDEITSQAWIDEVTKWPWILFHENPPIFWYAKEGICPRCKHHTVQVFGNAPWVPGVTAPKLGEAAAKLLEAKSNYGPPKTVMFQCLCAVAHPTHAAHEGCGQFALIPSWSAMPKPQP